MGFIKKKSEGFTISFQTRGVSIEQANQIWSHLNPQKIQESTDETGHCFFTDHKNLCFEIEKRKSGYVVWCGSEVQDD